LNHLLLGNRDRWPGEFQPFGIKGLSHQAAVVQVEQAPRGEFHVARQVGRDKLGRSSIHGADVNTVPLWIFRRAPIGKKEKMPAIRQKVWPPVSLSTSLAGWRGNSHRITTTVWNTAQWRSHAGREDNRPVAIPASPTPDRSRTQNLHSAARCAYGLQLPFAKKADAPAVGRPEGIGRIFGAADLL